MAKPEKNNPPPTPENPSGKISIIIDNINEIYDYALDHKYSSGDFDEYHSTCYLFQTEVKDNILDGYVHLDIHGSDYSATNFPNEFNLNLEITRFTGPSYGVFDKDKRYIDEEHAKKLVIQLSLLGYNAIYEKNDNNSQRIKLEKDGYHFIIALGFGNAEEHLQWCKTKNQFYTSNEKNDSNFLLTSTSRSLHVTLENPQMSIEDEIYKHYLPLNTKEEFTETINAFARTSENVLIALYKTYQELIPNLTFTTESPVYNPDYKKRPSESTNNFLASLTSQEEKRKEIISETTNNKIRFSDIAGQSKAIDEAKKLVLAINHSEIYDRRGVKIPKGILFYGPPGTGKTLLVKAIASEVDAELFEISTADIGTKWYGESEKNMQEIFDRASEISKSGKKTIIFFDELDSIAPSRDNPHSNEADKKIVSIILQNLDGLRTKDVIIIGTTNRPEDIDLALKRPGRIDKIISVDLPNLEDRKDILNLYIKKALKNWIASCFIYSSEITRPFSSDIDIQKIAEITNGMSGADLANVINLTLETKTILEVEGIRWSPINTKDIENTLTNYNLMKKEKNRLGFLHD